MLSKSILMDFISTQHGQLVPSHCLYPHNHLPPPPLQIVFLHVRPALAHFRLLLSTTKSRNYELIKVAFKEM